MFGARGTDCGHHLAALLANQPITELLPACRHMDSCESRILLNPVFCNPFTHCLSDSGFIYFFFASTCSRFPFPSSFALSGTAWPTHQPPPSRKMSRPTEAETTATEEAGVETDSPVRVRTVNKITDLVVGAEVGVVAAEAEGQEGHKPRPENNPPPTKYKQKARRLL